MTKHSIGVAAGLPAVAIALWQAWLVRARIERARRSYRRRMEEGKKTNWRMWRRVDHPSTGTTPNYR